MRLRPAAIGGGALALGVALGGIPGSAQAQRWYFDSGVRLTGTASSNPDLAPSGEEQPDVWVDISPYFSLNTTGAGGRLKLSGSGDLGASLRLSAREGADFSLRPSGELNASLEAVDNFFFVDARLLVASTLDNPFLATTDQFSPVNTSTSYQVGISPYIRGTLFGEFDYLVRSDNSWTDEAWGDSLNYRAQYSATNTVLVERSPRPLGGAFSFTQQLVSSDTEGQGLLDTQTARFSLRYALTTYLAVGARIGAERYNFTPLVKGWQRFYGAEASWRPNDRTTLEGYWEDRVFGNSWQATFNYRRPLMAFNAASSRLLSNTPQQFATFPGLSSLVSLLNSAFATRIPDPIERQRAVNDFLSQTQLPAELLQPTFIYSQNFTIQELNSGTLVYYGQRQSLALTAFQTVTEYSAGISAALPLSSKTKEIGTELVYNRRLSPVTSATAAANWRNTKNAFDSSQETTQTQFRLEASRQLARRTDGTLGARYQWISSTVTNDATEAALYFTLNYSFD